MKSLMTDEIEVEVYHPELKEKYEWFVFRFGCVLESYRDFETKSGAKRNWIAFAKRNGFKKWIFV